LRIIACVKHILARNAIANPEDVSIAKVPSYSGANPYDRYAVEAALQIREWFGGEVTALSMGPPSARETLEEVISMGADRGILLSDPAFAGADVYATAYALAQAIGKLGGAELIICGQQTSDGGTAQTPFSLAAILNIPSVAWVIRIERDKDGNLLLTQKLSESALTAVARFPMAAAINPQAARPRIATFAGRLKAKKSDIATWSLADMPDTEAGRYGLAGSRTRVKRVYPAKMTRKNPPIRVSPDQAARMIDEAVGYEKNT
jgi:electron transfer flavoprotein beta subunit